MTIILTGAAGFIGFHVAQRLLAQGHEVLGVDDLTPYYDVRLKEQRLAALRSSAGFRFEQRDVAAPGALEGLLEPGGVVCHLAAQAGVRHSLDQPFAYAHSNLTGFLAVLEACRHAKSRHLVYASSSSVYGNQAQAPFRADQPADHPVSLYAATKRANELMAHSYSHLYGMPSTGLRFFTVYGPWGRPDMAYWSFTEAILAGKPIRLFNHGQQRRDFTWIDDVAQAVVAVVAGPPSRPDLTRGAAASTAPWRIYNIGNSQPVTLGEFVACIERACGRQAIIEYAPAQPGDVELTAADCTPLARDYGFSPATPLAVGIERFVRWYRDWSGSAAG